MITRRQQRLLRPKPIAVFGLKLIFTALALAAAPLFPAAAKETSPRGAVAATWREAFSRMRPLPSPDDPADTRALRAAASSLEGKIMAGYQGWFAAPGDGSGLGWVHYGPGRFAPGTATIDLWPDMREAAPAESHATPFRHADGSPARVFSSYNPATVDRHFRWMREFGVDGVFLQRFVTDLREPRRYDWRTAVTDNVRAAAQRHGRTWAVMYDLSGMDPRKGDVERLMEDWRRLSGLMRVTREPAYQRAGGKPLVALWGVGFPNRAYTLKDAARLVDFLQNDPRHGGNAVMLGVPFGWRDGALDAQPSPELAALCARVEVVSPWSVGRYADEAGFLRAHRGRQLADLAWCREKKTAYLPVIFPGFSWKNLMSHLGQNPGRAIPRGDGSFYLAQGRALVESGAAMLYIAMFDEMDEGTAIFKTDPDPPSPAAGTEFVSHKGVPPEHFLQLTSRLGAFLKSKKAPPPPTPASPKTR
jgi:hypothetical protein